MPRGQDNKRKRSQLEKALRGLGLHGEYTALIHKAVVEDWDETEFLTRLVRTGTFRRSFRGLMEGGHINGFLTNGNPAVSVSNLRAAISNYHALNESYNQIISARGLPYKIDPKMMGALVRGNISPDEFGRRAMVFETARSNPGLFENLNEQFKAAGLQPLQDPKEQLRFLAGVAQPELYDSYEAAFLRNIGARLGTAEQAQGFAASFGAPGELTDLNAIASDFLRLRPDIQPELDRAGVSDADIIQFLAGNDTKGIAAIVQQAQAGRRALQRQSTGTFARSGAGGGPTLFRDDAGQVD